MELQRNVWGYSDIDVVPASMMIVAQHTGGHVYGAFDGDRLAGMAMAFAARKNGREYIHSHRVGVSPEYQNRGIGAMLKLYQRDRALAEGIKLIEWTFDPLQIRNAHFNICRLGVVIRRYLPNCYGITSSPLHASMPTDRFVAEWHLDSPRVRAVLSNTKASATAAREEVVIPRNIEEQKKSDPARILELQCSIRARFTELFAAGLEITDFQIGEENARYLLTTRVA